MKLKWTLSFFTMLLLCQTTSFSATPSSLITPDKVQTQIGTLEFKDGAPSSASVDKLYDNLDLIHGVNAFLNAYQGASTYAIWRGFLSIGAQNNSVVIFSKLMDAKSLFLTAN